MPQQMANHVRNLSVVDVYDIAAGIGKEFERLIDGYGPEAVTDLMPKVITVLEHLENLADVTQKDNGEKEELQYAIERLQAEKAAKAEERVKYENELEQIEESWQRETKEHLENITHLQEDNRKLRVALKEKEGQEDRIQRQDSEESRLVSHLQDTIHKQRQAIRALNHELSEKNINLDAMQNQLEHMARVNGEIRRKTTVTERRAQGLIQEQVDLQAQLHEKDQEIHTIKNMIRQQDDKVEASNAAPSPPESPGYRIQEQLELSGKMVVDKADPNQPRFSLDELRDVLQERNELKTKLIAVEEELDSYRPPDHKEEDPPVQGPINKEPDEKLFPEKYAKGESGIRKFFRSVLSPSGGSKSRSRKNIPSKPVVSTRR